jgi:hypothetical protein
MPASPTIQSISKPVKSRPVFWKYMLAVLFVLLLVVAILNLVVDPFSIYGTGLLPPLEINRYQLKLEMFLELDPPPEALVIGSSRVTFLDPEVITELTGKRCFMWGVPNAKAEVQYAILKMAVEEYNAPIKLVIVGVEPEVFHPTQIVHPEGRLTRAYTRYFDANPEWLVLSEKFGRLFSIEQAIKSINVIGREISGGEPEILYEFRADGFPLLPDNIYENVQDRLEYDVRTYPFERFWIDEFTHLSGERKQYFLDLLEFCNDRDIDVYAVSLPLHHDLIDRFVSLGARPILQETIEFLEDAVASAGGTYRNYTRVESFGGSREEFIDSVHFHPSNGNLLLRDLFADYGEN